jgi:signal transduction histidine kinase
MLSTDAERLRVALVNLILNARQAVEAGAAVPVASVAAAAAPGSGPQPSGNRLLPAPASAAVVRLATRATSEGISIVVADVGTGIAAADLPRVFDPYFTTKRGGTGLGLPITKNIIEGLGGTLSISSAQGGGTQMRIDLPLH